MLTLSDKNPKNPERGFFNLRHLRNLRIIFPVLNIEF